MKQTLPLHESFSAAAAWWAQDDRGARCHSHPATTRPMSWKSRTKTSLLSTPLLLACCLSIPKETIATNNLRQQQRQQQSTTTCIDQWHISIEDPASCTNSHVFPTDWAHSSVRDYIFQNTPDDCCKDVLAIAGTCNIINACDASDNYYNGAQQETTEEYFDRATCEKNTWHMSTEVLYACTNDDVYPKAWDAPLPGGRNYLFDSAAECCENSYPFQECEVIDTCPTPPPTPPPTSKPTRTRKPRPTMKPTSGPTPTPEPTPHPTSTPPDWFVDRAISQCVMDCVDEPRRPCGGRKSAWETSYPDVTACCESISWVPVEECMATAAPTTKKTDTPTRKVQGDDADLVLTQRPTMDFDWYREQATNICVQDCEDEPGYPCGGLAVQWDSRYNSVEECCASVPWKPFDDCATTAAPFTSSPTTSFPPTATPSPTRYQQQLDATPKPTRRSERTDRPTSNPTYKPTAECPAPHWFLFRNGARSTCINDSTYSEDILDPSMESYLIFESAEECCVSPLASNNCHVVDVCNIVIRWFADYSLGWDDGVCINNANQEIIPKGRRTFDSQLECCLGGFLGQTSEACLSFLSGGS